VSANELLLSKKNIDSLIIGDCIYSYLDKEMDSGVLKIDIENHFETLFDSEFRIYVRDELMKEENREYIGLYDSNIMLTENFMDASYISFGVSVQDPEVEFARIFWFRKVNDTWFFLRINLCWLRIYI